MAQQAGWQSNINKIVRRMDGDAVRSGLKAAGVMLQDIIKAEVEEGYTSKKYSKGIVAKTVVRGRPTTRKIWVGSPSTVAALWELGHVNRASKKYERVEVFRTSLEQNAHELARVFSDRYLEKLAEVAHKKLSRALAEPE